MNQLTYIQQTLLPEVNLRICFSSKYATYLVSSTALFVGEIPNMVFFSSFLVAFQSGLNIFRKIRRVLIRLFSQVKEFNSPQSQCAPPCPALQSPFNLPHTEKPSLQISMYYSCICAFGKYEGILTRLQEIKASTKIWSLTKPGAIRHALTEMRLSSRKT